MSDTTARPGLETVDALLAAVVDAAPDAVIGVDEDGTIAVANAHAERLFGYSRRELLGAPLGLLVPERSRDAHQGMATRYMQRAVGRPMSAEVDTHGRRRDGSEFPADIGLSCVHTPQGRLAIATIQDITARRRAERQREQALLELAEAQRIARLGSWSWDPGTGEATWSAEMYRIFGRDPAQGPAVGAALVALLAPVDGQDHVPPGAEAPLLDADYRIVRADGAERIVHAVGRESPERPGHHVGTVQDVTALRSGEQALRRSQRELRTQTALLSAVLDNAPIGMASVGPDGGCRRVNRALCEIVGYTEAELLEMTLPDLVHPDDAHRHSDDLQRLVSGEIRACQVEKRYRHKDGHTVWVRLSTAALRDEHGALVQYITQFEDITASRHIQEERARAELALQRERDHSQAILAAMSEGYGLTTVDGRLAAVNDALCAITGYAREELIGSELPFPYWSADLVQLTRALRERAIADGGDTFETTLTRRDGVRFEAEITVQIARDASGGLLGYVSTVRDVSEQKRYEAELTRLATHDPLTGLPNHRAFHDRLRAELARAARHRRPLSVAILDLDHFKHINDQHGHVVGDRVLALVANRLAGLVREDEILARVGGEEFAWILPDVDAGGALAAVERARQAVAATPIEPVGALTVSAGICDLFHAAEPTALYRHADEALYWAKEQGRNQVLRYSRETADRLRLREAEPGCSPGAYLTYLSELATATERKHPDFADHAARVADLARGLALRAGWPEAQADALHQAALLHDIGKIAVPDSILAKDAALTAAERAQLHTHAAIGAEMLAAALHSEQVLWVRHHHERWDGTGYPDRLAGDAVPDGAQLLSIADAYDAITHHRPYRLAMGRDRGLAEVHAHAGTQFAPRAVALLDEVLADRAGRGADSLDRQTCRSTSRPPSPTSTAPPTSGTPTRPSPPT